MEILSLIITLAGFLVIILVCISFFQSIFGGAPFVPAKNHILPFLIKELDSMNQDSIFVDLGCGNGKITRAVAEQFPSSKIIGIEISIIPYLFAKWNTRNYPNATILRKNFHNYDLTTTTHVFTYLLPAVLDQLVSKFENEFQPNTTVISCDFGLTKKQPKRIIHLPNKKSSDRCNKFLIYRY